METPTQRGARGSAMPDAARHALADVYRGGSAAQRLARRFAARTIEGDLTKHLRRFVLADVELRDPAPGQPLVLYANHHAFFDSYAIWFLLTRCLGRPFVVWMAEWDKAPLFGPVGALPFPADDANARVRTIRETARRMKADPRTALLLYPEGDMHPPEDGIAPFRTDLPRLARSLPETVAWVPAGFHVTWWGESRPSALLSLGEAHAVPDGGEAIKLAQELGKAKDVRPSDVVSNQATVLLNGRVGPEERWNLSVLAPLFMRLTMGPNATKREKEP